MVLTDNTLATANNLGTLSSTINVSDVIGGTDPVSYYRFTLSGNSDIFGSVDWATGSGNPAFLRLVADFNGNGLVENNERIRTLSAGADTSFFQSLPTGTYYLEVGTSNFLTRNYSIQLGVTPRPGNVSPEPGTTFSQALKLGTLSAQRLLRDYIGNAIDPVDTYQFTLSQKTNMGVLINGTTERLRVYVASDANGNGVYDSNETIESISGGSNTTFSVILDPGTYFLQAAPPPGSTFTYATHYELTLNPVPDFSGDDTLSGTSGQDVINGFAGNDIISGFAGNDRLFGDVGSDRLLGGGGKDKLTGGDGDDTLIGEGGKDKLIGGAGKDRLIGGRSKDVLKGGADADIFVINSFKGADRILDYKDGIDKFSLDGIRFSSLSFTQRNNNVLISEGNKVLAELRGVDVDVLDRRDFSAA
ncbi:MAG: calcium-binding protein [Leptolyngbyaceae bacterium]|nr:calcium-binding protein [Leptolyngbyaceae bacterium]